MDGRERVRTIAVLVVCQALLMASGSILLAFNSLVGAALAPEPRLATLPHALLNAVNAAMVTPASLFMLRTGRRNGFVLGSSAGLFSSVLSAIAIMDRSFALFCLGIAIYGGLQGFGQYYRYAAAEAAVQGRRNRVVAIVVGGSVLGVLVGPTVGLWAKDLIPEAPFAGSYLIAATFSLASAGALSSLGRLSLEQRPRTPQARLAKVLRRPPVLAAIVNSVVAFAVMVTVMVATPLAVVHAGHMVGDAAGVIQWHLLGMYVPSLITGTLVDRYGEVPVMAGGAVALLLSGLAAWSGTSMLQFTAALLLLGVGWNFLFLGSTAILAAIADPSERVKAQGANEFLVCVVTTVGALLAGGIFAHGGWSAVILVTYPLLAVAGLSTLRYANFAGKS